MNNIETVKVQKMEESCQRTTYYVMLYNSLGWDICAAGYATGSIYNNFEGLTKEEARYRAVSDAQDWADFLGLDVSPYIEDGVTYEAEELYRRFETRRVLAERKQNETKG